MEKTFPEHFLEVQGTKVRYFDLGQGPALVLIHGLGGAAINWFRNVDALSRKCRVIALDLPSFGKSETPEVSADEISYDYFTSFLKDFLDQLKVRKTILVGNSMGGGIGVDFTLKFPQKVERLVVVDGSGLGQEISSYKMLRQPLLQKILFQIAANQKIMRQAAKLAVCDPGTVDEATIAAYVNWLKNPKVRKIIDKLGTRAVDDRGQRWLFVDRLKEIDCPTLIIWGRNDRVIPLKQALKAHRLIRKSKLAVFNHCGHLPHLEKPSQFNRTLLEFLEDDKLEGK